TMVLARLVRASKNCRCGRERINHSMSGIMPTLPGEEKRTISTHIKWRSALQHLHPPPGHAWCCPVMVNIPAKRIDEKSGLWHVILDPSGAEPMEAWARPSSFRE
ncbi:MAG: hypothetical protein QOF90_3725, partial [Acetobacteraceae bacterium]|nr:hypothetical protein [Acetobacteraceae bacterium]